MANIDIPETTLDVLAIGPHCDDIELCCAGTLIRLVDLGYRVGIADLTAGEMGTRGTPEERREEAACAARAMGIDYRVNLGLPDGNVQINDESVDAMIRLIRATRPALVIGPPETEARHPDHSTAGKLLLDTAFRAGFPKWDTGQHRHRPFRIVSYMMATVFTPTFVVNITEQWERKLAAIRCYRSQLGVTDAERKDEQTVISSPQFLTMIEARARYYGSQIAADFGEPFFQREMIRIDDPMELIAGSFEQYGEQAARRGGSNSSS